jgi:peptide-methionine (S)-S-oxide reductase
MLLLLLLLLLINCQQQETKQAHLSLTEPTFVANNNNNNMTVISKTLALGAGCYWGTEKYIVKDFQKKFPDCIADAKVGFMSPDKNAMKDPSYRQVCSGTTSHVEVLNVVLKDESATPELFEELVKFFFMFHDPTTKNRQGNDAGPQYASVIFCSDEQQTAISNKVVKELQQALDKGLVTSYDGKKIESGVVDYNDFYVAQADHQEYLSNNPSGYCNHRFRFKEWPRV